MATLKQLQAAEAIKRAGAMVCKLVPLLLLMLLLTAAAASSSTISLPHCPDKCGDVTIPYPFGIGPGCFRDGFEITCISKDNNPSKAFLSNSSIELTEIPYAPYLPGQARVQMYSLSSVCYAMDQSGTITSQSFVRLNLTTAGPMYRFSNTRTKYTMIGCDSVSYMGSQPSTSNPYDYDYYVGCVSYCNGVSEIINGTCFGIGCCQSTLQSDLKDGYLYIGDYRHDYDIVTYSRCTYSFLVAADRFNFTSANLTMDASETLPVWLDWAVRENSSTCAEAQHYAANYACRSSNSQCFNSTNGPGYLCSCSQGYEGNPYLVDGCQDIDECKIPQNYTCHGICTNTRGSYECTCPHGTHGDNPKEQPCNPNFPLVLKLVTGLSVGIVGMLIITILMLMEYQKRKLKRVRKEFFEKNGGSILRGKMQAEKVDMPMTIFSEDELKRATENFAKGKLLGEGGRGEVYLGTLDDSRIAVKRAKVLNMTDQAGEFANEIYILSQVNHKNVVKLLGCCLEVDVPMLVYEYMQRGSLYELLHGENPRPVSLSTRLSIAIDSAEALAHLHSSRSPAIIHGDVKSLNILLDDYLNPKVADFGASQLLTANDAQFAALVQVTYGYLDPEVMHTHRLTEKSDVYSFGVVILELFTRQKAFYKESGDKKSLATMFKSAMKGHKLDDILDAQIQSEEGVELFQQIAELVMRCLSNSGEERPTMTGVVERLHALGRLERQSSMRQSSMRHKSEEIANLGPIESSTKHHMLDTSGQESVEAKTLLNIGTGR